jgi:hypothetical protein
VLCEFRPHVGNVGVPDGPKILHPRHHKTPNVAKFGAKRIRVGIRSREVISLIWRSRSTSAALNHGEHSP